MCDFLRSIGDAISSGVSGIGNAVTRAVTPPGTGGLEALAEQNKRTNDQLLSGQQTQNQIAQDTLTFAKDTQAQARATSDAALADQRKANDIAKAASVPAIDSEAARIAADSRLRKLLSAGAFGVKAGLKNLGDAPIGYRPATGA
jgi:hypothetical protein